MGLSLRISLQLSPKLSVCKNHHLQFKLPNSYYIKSDDFESLDSCLAQEPQHLIIPKLSNFSLFVPNPLAKTSGRPVGQKPLKTNQRGKMACWWFLTWEDQHTKWTKNPIQSPIAWFYKTGLGPMMFPPLVGESWEKFVCPDEFFFVFFIFDHQMWWFHQMWFVYIYIYTFIHIHV